MPVIFAHRGASAHAPENTMAAFQLAVEAGADGIELDIHLTQDDRLVVCHDPELGRTMPGKGLIRELFMSHLEHLDAGSWFSSHFKRERLPTLEQVLHWAPSRLWINIEVKETEAPGVERKLLETLNQFGRREWLILSSFDHAFLQRLGRLDKNLALGVLLEPESDLDPIAVAQAIGPSVFSIHPDESTVTPEGIRRFHSQGWRVFPYTVNDPKRARQLLDWGVDGLFSDDPGKLIEIKNTPICNPFDPYIVQNW